MRLTITILCGTRAGQRFVVASGNTLRIGRTTKSDVVVADDPTMSALHFELEGGETATVVRDLQSRNRLFLNGEPVTEAIVVDGDQLRAGRTFFSIAIEDPFTPTIVPGAADETQAPGPLDATRAVRRAPASSGGPQTEPLPAATLFPGQFAGDFDAEAATADSTANDGWAVVDRRHAVDRLYAVVDGEVAAQLIEEARRANLRTASLAFVGLSPYLSAVAPYLVEVTRDSPFSTIWNSTHDRNPGILIESPADFDELLIHLRSIFCRRDDEGRLALFRFYEPNLLYQWLKGCSTFQLASFFGCLTSVVLRIGSGAQVLRLTHAGEQLVEEEVGV